MTNARDPMKDGRRKTQHHKADALCRAVSDVVDGGISCVQAARNRGVTVDRVRTLVEKTRRLESKR